VKKIKVLNLYAGVGGNRKLWENVEVTAIENQKYIADKYKDLFPNDKVLITNAHEFLIENYDKFDFIWSSPPCPTHSVTNHFLHHRGIKRYPDMNLWQEIIYLKKWFKGYFVVENVIPYYKPLIKPTVKIDRHLFWSNFDIESIKIKRNFNITNCRASTRSKNDSKSLENYHKIKLGKIKNKRKLLRNCVNPIIGKHIFNEFLKKIKNSW
jgi:DNA (cytosine-5)-methyltransferase 1